jgi:hypothetical protein
MLHSSFVKTSFFDNGAEAGVCRQRTPCHLGGDGKIDYLVRGCGFLVLEQSADAGDV